MKYTEEQLRELVSLIDDAYRPYTKNREGEDIVENYIKGYYKTEEKEIPFTYFSLRQYLDWEKFCDLTGVSYYATREGFEIKDNEIFYIKESKAKRFNLI